MGAIFLTAKERGWVEDQPQQPTAAGLRQPPSLIDRNHRARNERDCARGRFRL